MRPSARILLTFVVLASGLLHPPVAPAQATDAAQDDARIGERPYTEEMIVTGSRLPRVAATQPSFASVLEGEDLDTSISLSLDDALRFVPGLQVTQDGGRGGRAQIALRGLDPNHVVVLIDGVRLNDPTNPRGGAFDPTTLALLDIERVEVVRGPLSTVYGSDALAGAINIITRRGEPNAAPEMSVRVRGGRFHTGNAIAQARTGLGEHVGLSLGAALDTFRDPNSDGGYDGASLKAKLNATVPILEIDVEAFTRIHQGSARSFPDSSGGSELAVLRSMEDRDIREILFGLSLERSLADAGRLAVRASRASRREDLDSPGIAPGAPVPAIPPNTAGDEYERWDLAVVSTWTPPDLETPLQRLQSTIVAGIDFVWEDGESDSSPTTPFYDNRRTIGVFGELEEQIGEAITITGSLRYDSTPDENDRLSPAGGLTIAIPNTPITLFGNYGEGYKRPSFYALGSQIGNPNLRSEKSRGWEIGARGEILDGRLRGQLSYFDVRVKDLIDFNAATFQLQNRRRLISQGVELELGWQALDWIDLRGGLTWNTTDFRGISDDPLNRPRWRGFATIAVEPTERLELAIRALLVGPSKASSYQTGARELTLAGYERIDIRVGWIATDGIELFVEVENLTNATPREAVGFESPGIAPRAGVILRL